MPEYWTVNSKLKLADFLNHARQLFEKNGYVIFSWKIGRQRTERQNAGIHVFCCHVAAALNDAGYEMMVSSPVLKQPVEVNWTKESVKELMWRPVQMAKYPEKVSTTQLERVEVAEVAEVIIRYLAEKKGVVVNFPSRVEGQ